MGMISSAAGTPSLSRRRRTRKSRRRLGDLRRRL